MHQWVAREGNNHLTSMRGILFKVLWFAWVHRRWDKMKMGFNRRCKRRSKSVIWSHLKTVFSLQFRQCPIHFGHFLEASTCLIYPVPLRRLTAVRPQITLPRLAKYHSDRVDVQLPWRCDSGRYLWVTLSVTYTLTLGKM